MQEGPYSKVNPSMLGDVVISVETAQRQATLAGLSVGRVLEMLLVHGVLHLVGYDHEESEEEARRMEEKEAEILQALKTKCIPAGSGKGPKEVQ